VLPRTRQRPAVTLPHRLLEPSSVTRDDRLAVRDLDGRPLQQNRTADEIKYIGIFIVRYKSKRWLAIVVKKNGKCPTRYSTVLPGQVVNDNRFCLVNFGFQLLLAHVYFNIIM